MTNKILKNISISSVGFWLGLIVFCILWFGFDPLPGKPVGEMAAITALMAIWWTTEPVPIAATSLIPIVVFPFSGIMSAKDVAPLYMNTIILLYIGAFIIALAMERWNLHRRIGLFSLLIFGKNPERLVLGFMIACAFLSMWISNTAAAVAMLPVGMAVLAGIEEQAGTEKTRNLGVCLMLGIAYSCTIGGSVTLVGTPVNLIFKSVYESSFPDAGGINFLKWSIVAFPISLIMLIVAYNLLVKVLFKPDKNLVFGKRNIMRQYLALGPVSREEKWILTIFLITIFLWFFRADIEIGRFKVPGWASLLNISSLVDDGTVAVVMAFLLFLIPAKKNGENSRLVTNSIFRQIPWDVVLLFGGGFALASGITNSGLSIWMGETMFNGLSNVSTIPMMAGVGTLGTFLSEVTSNTALSQIVQPILASVSKSQGIIPLLLMVPAALNIANAFMLPVGTPPNAIVYGSGKITIRQMVLAGFILSIVGVIVSVFIIYFIGIPLLSS